MNDIDLPAEVKAQYINMRVLADGRICGVHRLLYHWTLHVDINEYGYEDRYCYESVADAIVAMHIWDGTGDPEGWHRHPKSHRRRNLKTGEEWVAA